MKGSFIAISCFVAGILIGVFSSRNNFEISPEISKYVLCVLLFVFGIVVGGNKEAWKTLKNLNFKILLVPMMSIVGTYLGVFVASLIITDIKLSELFSVGSFFGWYSFTSVLTSSPMGEDIVTIALLTNIIRESAVFLLGPLFVRWFGKLSIISVAGATCMDTTLPFVTETTGKKYGFIAFFSGFVLTLAVPLLVGVFMTLA